jgi:hypothetical protein
LRVEEQEMQREIRFMLSCLAIAACGSVPGGDEAEALQAAPAAPSPFTLQFTGRYEGAEVIELRRDGSYVAITSGGCEQGRFSSTPAQRTLPLEIRLRTHGRAWKAVVDAYDGKLRLLRSGAPQTLQLSRPQKSDEELCDSTHGRWTDDDPDPATGLYCVCPAGKTFIPGKGGCVD